MLDTQGRPECAPFAVTGDGSKVDCCFLLVSLVGFDMRGALFVSLVVSVQLFDEDDEYDDMTGRNQASNSQLASPSQSGSSASAQNGTTDGTPKSERPLPGALPQGTPDSGLDTPRDTAGLTGLPWKLWRPGSHQEPATAQQQQQQQQSGGKPASNGSNSGGGTQPFLDLMSFPSLNLNNLNPLSFLSASSNSGKSSTSPSSSRQATPRPLAAPHLGAPFEEVPGPSQTAPKKPAALHVDAQEEQNLKLDEDGGSRSLLALSFVALAAIPSAAPF